MFSIAEYLTSLQEDKEGLIEKYAQRGVVLDSSATFTDLLNNFERLFITATTEDIEALFE